NQAKIAQNDKELAANEARLKSLQNQSTEGLPLSEGPPEPPSGMPPPPQGIPPPVIIGKPPIGLDIAKGAKGLKKADRPLADKPAKPIATNPAEEFAQKGIKLRKVDPNQIKPALKGSLSPGEKVLAEIRARSKKKEADTHIETSPELTELKIEE